MLTTGQVDHFSTFGFTVLRGYIANGVTAAHPRRAGVTGRMRHAGILDLPGARDGW
jgi:hypothetical protein